MKRSNRRSPQTTGGGMSLPPFNPCPNCGRTAVQIEERLTQIGHGEAMATCHARCSGCGSTVSRSGYPGEPLAAQVAAKWNEQSARSAIHPATVAACIARLEQGGQSAAVSILRHHFEQKGSAL